MKNVIALILLSCLFGCARFNNNRDLSSEQVKNDNVEWLSYGNDLAASKFSYADQIDKTNVHQVKLLWNWKSIDNDIVKKKKLNTSYNESTPLMVDGKVFVSTNLNQVASLNPLTGELIWSFDPKVYETYNNKVFGLTQGPVNQNFVQRGLSYKKIDGRGVIFLNTNDSRLISIDAETGKVNPGFGKNGTVDVIEHLQRGKINHFNIGNTSPALICNN